MSQPAIEKRSIRLGPAAAMHIIHSQAGTLGKAILEYVMNSIDAGASRCDVSITPGEVVISDDGSGFDCRSAIEGMFEVLCFEHDENDHRRWGKFGMGRAQMFSFAKTLWRTRSFSMDVDVRNRGLDYDLCSDLEDSPGCTVTCSLYDPLSDADQYSLVRELGDLVRYCPVPVVVNGEQLSTDPESEQWDHVTDEAYIRIRDGGEMSVYNLGVLVRKFPGWQFSKGGEIVSRKQLDLNFARNDILVSRCKVWRKIKPFVERKATDATRKKKTLSDDQRRNLLLQFLDGQITYDEIQSLPVLKAITGRGASPENVFVNSRRSRSKVRLALGSYECKRASEVVHQQKIAWVLHPEMVFWLGLHYRSDHAAAEKAFFDKLRRCLPERVEFDAVPLAEVRELVDCSHSLIDEKKLSKRDKAILAAIREASGRLHNYCREFRSAAARKIVLGRSESALAWTDGKSFIAIDQRHARQCQTGLDGCIRVLQSLVHEWCHDEPTADDHDHDHAFYERFHDAFHNAGGIVRHLMARLIRELKRAGYSPSAKLMSSASLIQESASFERDDGADSEPSANSLRRNKRIKASQVAAAGATAPANSSQLSFDL